ncbi:hypothetical protein KAR91_84775 [Candidatus Pacearchaeota archaeon]|nr:hypothetical protein [Candidatus Pacearchaeota archaeon]
MIIDTKKKEYEHLPKSLKGEVLLEETFDEGGNLSGFLTIKPEVLKYFAESKTKGELKEMGYDKFNSHIEKIKGMNITPKNPLTR